MRARMAAWPRRSWICWEGSPCSGVAPRPGGGPSPEYYLRLRVSTGDVADGSYCDHVTTPDGDCPDSSDTDTTCIPDTREACLLRVTMTYRSDVIVPFIGGLIGTDVNGRFAQTSTATMVIN